MNYDPLNWFWVVAGDDSRWWSSATSSYIAPDKSFIENGGVPTRIISEKELSDVLAKYDLSGPHIDADVVRREAQKRMMELLGARDQVHLETKISNGSREAIRLLRIGSDNWTKEEKARVATLDYVDKAIESIREASNTLEAMGKIPANYSDDKHWP